MAEELVDHGVDDLLFNTEMSVFWVREGGTGGFAEETVGLGEDVGFVGYGYERFGVHALHTRIPDLLSAERDFASHGRDTMACAFGDAFYGFCNFAGTVGGVKSALFFYVEVFCVFADDNEVNWCLSRGRSPDGSDIGVEIKFFPQGDNGGGVAGNFGGWGADGSEKSPVTFFFQGFNGLFWKGSACFFEGIKADGKVYEGELKVERA